MLATAPCQPFRRQTFAPSLTDRQTFAELTQARAAYWHFTLKPEAYVRKLRENQAWIEEMLLACGESGMLAGAWHLVANWQNAETDEELLALAPEVFPAVAKLFLG